MTAPESSKRLSTAVPTAEEYALLREAYAETYPVRTLLNAIDAKDTEIERLRAALAWYAKAREAQFSEDYGTRAIDALGGWPADETTSVTTKGD